MDCYKTRLRAARCRGNLCACHRPGASHQTGCCIVFNGSCAPSERATWLPRCCCCFRFYFGLAAAADGRRTQRLRSAPILRAAAEPASSRMSPSAHLLRPSRECPLESNQMPSVCGLAAFPPPNTHAARRLALIE